VVSSIVRQATQKIESKILTSGLILTSFFLSKSFRQHLWQHCPETESGRKYRASRLPRWVKSAALDVCQSLPVFLDKRTFSAAATCLKRANSGHPGSHSRRLPTGRQSGRGRVPTVDRAAEPVGHADLLYPLAGVKLLTPDHVFSLRL
jgi:hypothetical protein